MIDKFGNYNNSLLSWTCENTKQRWSHTSQSSCSQTFGLQE